MEISRTRRVLGWLINSLTFGGLLIGNIILLAAKRTTLGGLVGHYRFKGGSLVMLFFTKLLFTFVYIITFAIMWFADIIGMDKRNGTFAEKMAGVTKVSR